MGYAYAQQKEYHKNIVGQGRVYLNELGLVREAPVAMGWRVAGRWNFLLGCRLPQRLYVARVANSTAIAWRIPCTRC